VSVSKQEIEARKNWPREGILKAKNSMFNDEADLKIDLNYSRLKLFNKQFNIFLIVNMTKQIYFGPHFK